jgi:hypothetical protein
MVIGVNQLVLNEVDKKRGASVGFGIVSEASNVATPRLLVVPPVEEAVLRHTKLFEAFRQFKGADLFVEW